MVFFKRDYKHQKKKMQLLNKDWGESNPMSYDWEMKTKNLDAWHKQVSASMPGYKEPYPKDTS